MSLAASAAGPAGTQRRMRSLAPPHALLALIGIILLWQLATLVFRIPAYLLPSPWAVALNIQKHAGLLLSSALITGGEVVLGFALSVLIGVPLSILITYSRVLDRALYPLIVGSQTIPKVAIAPLLLAWFGFGLTPKIVIVVLVTFFPIVINSVVGLRSGPAQMIHLARSMGATNAQIFWRFRLPQALPSMFAGMKLATVLAVIGAIVAEFVGADSGLGYLIMIAGSNFDLGLQFAAIVVLSAMGMAFFWVLGIAERMALPWHVSMRSEGE